MVSRLAADVVLISHLAFMLFVLLGGLLALKWRGLMALHLPAAGWGFYIELTGGVCPLTVLENHLRVMAGQSGYPGSFIEHYLLGVIYPEGLTREVQYVLAGGVLAINALIYGLLVMRRRQQA